MDEARRELESARKDLNVAQNALKVLLNVEDAIHQPQFSFVYEP